MNLPTPLQEAYNAQNNSIIKNTTGGDTHVYSRRSDKLARKTAKKATKLAKKQARAAAKILKNSQKSSEEKDVENKRIAKEQARTYKQDSENEKKAAKEQDVENKRIAKEQYAKQQARDPKETIPKEMFTRNKNNTLLAWQRDTSISEIVKVSNKTETNDSGEIVDNYPAMQVPRSKKDLIKLVVALSDANMELRKSLTTNTLADPGRAAGVLLAQAAHAAEQMRQDAEQECSAMVKKAAQETEQILDDVRDKVSGAMLEACRQAVESINKIKRN